MTLAKVYVKMSVVVMVLITWADHTFAQNKMLSLSGFSELRFETQFGSHASQRQFDSIARYNNDAHDYEQNTRFYVPNLNLNLLSELSDKLYFQGELGLHFHETIGLELLRAYVDYRLHPSFNIQIGKFLTPFGYLNRNQRFYGYLNNSIRSRDMVNELFGFAPIFTTGMQVYGTFDVGDDGTTAVRYMIAAGVSRAQAPHGFLNSGWELQKREHNALPGVSALVEWTTLKSESLELTWGVSGYVNPKIETFWLQAGVSLEEGVDTFTDLELREWGVAPYFRMDHHKWQLITELHTIHFQDMNRVTRKKSYQYLAGSMELMRKTKLQGNPLGVYARFDFRNVDHDHPYYGLTYESEVFHKNFVTTQQELSVGLVWDVFPSNRIKAEYGAVFEGAAPGNRISISTSFAF